MRNAEKFIGLLAFFGFAACVPGANWMINNVGTVCISNGPCLIPVAPGILAPSGVLLIGFAFVLRDIVQRHLGILFSLIAIAIGAILSASVSPKQLVVASATAFLFSEIADFLVYTPLQRKHFILAIILSGIVGSLLDSLLFVFIAFGNIDYFLGQAIGKILVVILFVPPMLFLRFAMQRAFASQ